MTDTQQSNYTLISTLTDDGNSATFYGGGERDASIAIYGTFGSGTAKVQVSPDEGTTWVDLTDASYTAAAVTNVKQPLRTPMRVNLASSSGPSLKVSVGYCQNS